MEYLTADRTTDIQKETIWRLAGGASTKKLFCDSFEHIIACSASERPFHLVGSTARKEGRAYAPEERVRILTTPEKYASFFEIASITLFNRSFIFHT
jgi:hypothetical protein